MITGIGDGKLPPVLVAKNGRARKYIDDTLDLSGLAVQEMRAEDIPLLVDKELPQYLGLTTTEIVANYFMLARKAQLEVLRTISWEDSGCLYGKPAICAIGKDGVSKALLQLISQRGIIVAINKKSDLLSAALASGYLNMQNITFKPLSGEIEAAVKLLNADMVVEIVGSGRTATATEENGGYGLQIYAPLFFIDLVMVGNKNYLSQLRGWRCYETRTG